MIVYSVDIVGILDGKCIKWCHLSIELISKSWLLQMLKALLNTLVEAIICLSLNNTIVFILKQSDSSIYLACSGGRTCPECDPVVTLLALCGLSGDGFVLGGLSAHAGVCGVLMP